MQSRFAGILLMLITVAGGAYGATRVEKLRNDKVAVFEDTLAPGESAVAARPSVIIYFTNGEIAHRRGNERSVRRGETVFWAAHSAAVRNAGDSPIRFIEVDFLGEGNPEMWGHAGLAPRYKVLIENRYTRTYDVKIAAGATEPLHTHHARVVVALSGAVLEHRLPNGQVQPATLKTGEITWRPAQTHVGHNLGKTNLWVICIEPK